MPSGVHSGSPLPFGYLKNMTEHSLPQGVCSPPRTGRVSVQASGLPGRWGAGQGPSPGSPLTSRPPPPPQVSNWMEQEGSRCLRALTPRDGSLETVEQAHAAFEDFFLQAAVRSGN